MHPERGRMGSELWMGILIVCASIHKMYVLWGMTLGVSSLCVCACSARGQKFRLIPQSLVYFRPHHHCFCTSDAAE